MELLPILTMPAPEAACAPIFPERVTFPDPALWLISRLVRAVAPIFPAIITLPVPDKISRFLPPVIVEEKSTFPPPVPDEITTAPPSVTGALISIKPSAVVMLLEMVNAVVSIVKASKAVLQPITPPRVIVPAPLSRVRLSVPLPSALMVVLKSIFPSSAVPPLTSVVIEMAPSITTAPSKSNHDQNMWVKTVV